MRLRFRWGRRRLVTGMAALLVAVGGAGAWAATRSNDAAAATPTVVAASSGTIRQTVAATGTIEPAVQSTLGFAVGGTVTTVPVAVGDHVTKGSVLATVDLTDLRSAVELAQAALDAAVEQQTADGERRLLGDAGRLSRRTGRRRAGQAGRRQGVPGRRHAALAHQRDGRLRRAERR